MIVAFAAHLASQLYSVVAGVSALIGGLIA
jgi:hypothetical protein